jgi:hypothetical protein
VDEGVDRRAVLAQLGLGLASGLGTGAPFLAWTQPSQAGVPLDFVDDGGAIKRFKMTLPEALIAKAAWPSDALAPDYAHLDLAPRNNAFVLTPAVLIRLLMNNGFGRRQDETKHHDADHILFGLRGCVLAKGQTAGVLNDRVNLVAVRPDLRNPRCVVGVWRRRAGPAGPAGLLVVPGSTVPNADAVALQYHVQQQTAVRAKELGPTLGVARAANLLPTGRYNYLIGDHGYYGGAFPRFQGVFRLARRPGRLTSMNPRAPQASIPVLRPSAGPTIDLTSRWDIWAAFDNIHPGVTPKLVGATWARGVRFSSEGCVTIWDNESYIGGPYGEGRNWLALRAACGLTDLKPNLSRYHSFCLLTGTEAALAAENRTRPRLRYGSDGKEVTKLQRRLDVDDPDLEFGEATLKAWLADQRQRGVQHPLHVWRA